MRPILSQISKKYIVLGLAFVAFLGVQATGFSKEERRAINRELEQSTGIFEMPASYFEGRTLDESDKRWVKQLNMKLHVMETMRRKRSFECHMESRFNQFIRELKTYN
jgi:hypothetical protein